MNKLDQVPEKLLISYVEVNLMMEHTRRAFPKEYMVLNDRRSKIHDLILEAAKTTSEDENFQWELSSYLQQFLK